MKTTRLALALILMALIANVSYAQTSYTSSGSGSWSTSTNWTPNGVPGAQDTATIQPNHTIDVTGDQEIFTLILQDHATTPGTLDINEDASLTINHALEMERTLAERGKIVFSGNTGTDPGELIVGSNANIAMHGDVDVTGTRGGKISSSASGNVLTIAPNATVTAGSGPLELAADMVMDGKVEVNSGQTVTVSSFGPRPGSSGQWLISSTGTLKFNTTSAVDIIASSGYIEISANGTLDIDQSLTYAGGIRQTNGKIEVAVNKSFEVTGRFIE